MNSMSSKDVRSKFPNNPVLQRAHLMNDESFRLTPRELKQIHRHQHPYMPSPFTRRQVDRIQKPQSKAQLLDGKFGRHAPHPMSLHRLGHANINA